MLKGSVTIVYLILISVSCADTKKAAASYVNSYKLLVSEIQLNIPNNTILHPENI